MKQYCMPLCWAAAMIVMALGARLGWVERDAAMTLLLVMPVLAFVTMQRGGSCAARTGNA